MLHTHLQLPRGLAVGWIYLCLVILVPRIQMLILSKITNALVFVGSLDYESILQSIAEWLRTMLTTIKAVQLPMAGLNAHIDGVVDTMQKAYKPISPTVAVPPSFDAILQPLSSTQMSVVTSGANMIGTVISQAVKIGFIFLASINISLEAHTYPDAFLQTAPAAYRPKISTLIDRIERVGNALFHGELILMLGLGG